MYARRKEEKAEPQQLPLGFEASSVSAEQLATSVGGNYPRPRRQACRDPQVPELASNRSSWSEERSQDPDCLSPDQITTSQVKDGAGK
eukprot:766330-Hanusia_phi.AAC.3